MKLKSSTRQVEGFTIVDLSGQITLGEASVVVRDVINDLMGKGDKKVLLNLGEVDYIDSSGIGFTTVRSQGGELKLVNLSKRIRDLLLVSYTRQSVDGGLEHSGMKYAPHEIL